jgi:hypothetical protein
MATPKKPMTKAQAVAYFAEKFQGKIDHGDFKSVVSFLTRTIIEKRLRVDLFASTAEAGRRVKKTKNDLPVLGRKTKKVTGRR